MGHEDLEVSLRLLGGGGRPLEHAVIVLGGTYLMLRLLSGILAGAIVLSIWNAAYWLTIGRMAVGVIPDEAAVTSAIRERVPGPGAYFFPGLPRGEISAAQQRDFLERHRRGPIGMLIVHEPGGGETLEVETLVLGFAIPLITAALIALVLRSVPAGSAWPRWRVAILMGLAAAVGSHGLQWNQFHLPGSYSAFLVADVAISWALAGGVIAAILPTRIATRAAVAD